MARRWLDEASAKDLGRLDVAAIDRVRAEAWPEATSADEMHDALLGLGFVTDAEAKAHDHWPAFLEDLASARRATRLMLPGAPSASGSPRTAAAIRRVVCEAARHHGSTRPRIRASLWERDEALAEVLRRPLEALGPVTVTTLARRSGSRSTRSRRRCKTRGRRRVIQGMFTPVPERNGAIALSLRASPLNGATPSRG